jgi:hypothetical protein
MWSQHDPLPRICNYLGSPWPASAQFNKPH